MTARNQKFIELYIQYVVLQQAPPGKRCSAAQAYSDAGYKSDTPEVTASKLLSNINIAAEIDRRRQEISDRNKLTTEKVLNELSLLGFANMADYYKPNGKLKKVTELTREQAAAIKEVSYDKKGRLQYKLFDKPEALELLGRNRGAFPNKMAIGGDPDNHEGITIIIGGEKR